MFVIREVFKAKPGKAKNLVEIFKSTSAVMKSVGIKNSRVMTDIVADYWTVVWEFEVDELGIYFSMLENPTPAFTEKMGASMTGYMDYVLSGHREVFRVC